MRAYRCDRCAVVIDQPGATQIYELGQPERGVEPAHFCSALCLIAWSTEQYEEGRIQ